MQRMVTCLLLLLFLCVSRYAVDGQCIQDALQVRASARNTLAEKYKGQICREVTHWLTYSGTTLFKVQINFLSVHSTGVCNGKQGYLKLPDGSLVCDKITQTSPRCFIYPLKTLSTKCEAGLSRSSCELGINLSGRSRTLTYRDGGRSEENNVLGYNVTYKYTSCTDYILNTTPMGSQLQTTDYWSTESSSKAITDYILNTTPMGSQLQTTDYWSTESSSKAITETLPATNSTKIAVVIGMVLLLGIVTASIIIYFARQRKSKTQAWSRTSEVTPTNHDPPYVITPYAETILPQNEAGYVTPEETLRSFYNSTSVVGSTQIDRTISVDGYLVPRRQIDGYLDLN